MAEKKKENFKRFRKTMEGLEDALKYSGEEGVKSKDIGRRNKARDFALKHFLSDKGEEARKETIRNRNAISDSTYDVWFQTAIKDFRLRAVNEFLENRKKILDEADLEKLAKNYLLIQPVKVQGDETHNKAAELHGKYMQLENIINAAKKEDNRELGKQISGIAVQLYAESHEIKEDIRKRQENEVNAELMNSFQQALSIHPDMAIAYIKDEQTAARKGIEKILATDRARSQYALRNLNTIMDELKEGKKKLEKEYTGIKDKKGKKYEDRREEIEDGLDENYGMTSGVLEQFYKAATLKNRE